MKFQIPKTILKKGANCITAYLFISIACCQLASSQILNEKKKEVKILNEYEKQTQMQKIINDSLHAIWVVQTDSIIKLNRIDVSHYSRIGFMKNLTEGGLCFNSSFILRKYRTFDFGIGSGVEYYNRGQGFIQLIQIPFFVSNHIYLSRKSYFIFEPGMMVPISGFYYSDLTPSPNVIKEKINLLDSELKSTAFFTVGLGIYTRKKICFEFIMRNQSTGITYPIQKRVNMFGFNLGIKL